MPTAAQSAAGAQTRRALCRSTRTACLCVPAPVHKRVVGMPRPAAQLESRLVRDLLIRHAVSIGMLHTGSTSRRGMQASPTSREPHGLETTTHSAHQSHLVLQALQLRRARQRGLQVGGLGFGMAPTRADQMAALLRTHEPRPGSAFR